MANRNSNFKTQSSTRYRKGQENQVGKATFLSIDFVLLRINNTSLNVHGSKGRYGRHTEPQDLRNINIDQVGVKGIRYPITVRDKDEGEQQTVARINMYVNLASPIQRNPHEPVRGDP